MVSGFQEVGRLVVFIQNVNLEVGEGWQWVAIVLLGLKKEEKKKKKKHLKFGFDGFLQPS